MISKWIELPRAWKTEQASQAINLLKGHRIMVKTEPDEFSGEVGNNRMMFMDPDKKWPIYVKARQFESAIAILKDEHLL